MKIGFIGCGNMAGAIMGGLIRKKVFAPNEITAFDINKPLLEKRVKEFGITASQNNIQMTETSEVLILAVKPQYYEEVITEIRDAADENKLIITIAPGKTLSWLKDRFQKEVKLIRTMPNTPALVGEGMTGVCRNENVTDSEMEYGLKIISSFGKAEVVPEKLMDAVVAVSGSSPAYVFMFIEAMADAAVSYGMARPEAYEFAAQAVLGSAKMVLETKKHPGELKDMVCSPAGTTIEAVKVLEAEGFRSAVMKAMDACVEICGKL